MWAPYGPHLGMFAGSESVELSKSLWAFGEAEGPRSVCESSVSQWDLRQPVGLQFTYL